MSVVGFCNGSLLPCIFPSKREDVYSDGKNLYIKDTNGKDYKLTLGKLRTGLIIDASYDKLKKVVNTYREQETIYIVVVTQAVTYTVFFNTELMMLCVELFSTEELNHIGYVDLPDGIKLTEVGSEKKDFIIKYPMHIVNT